LVNCPRCGTAVEAPVKTWAIPSRRPLKEGEEPRLAGIFECPKCEVRFRAAVMVRTKTAETANVKNMAEKIKSIKGELMQTLINLREKIKTLETERANLMVEIEKLRMGAEARVTALENEVGMLRNDAKSLRDLLGHEEEVE
jgi:hypothetical protein